MYRKIYAHNSKATTKAMKNKFSQRMQRFFVYVYTTYYA